jgi:arylsulfatase
MPTLLDIAGVAHPEQHQSHQVEWMRGKSLRGVLSRATQTIYSDEDFVEGEMDNGKYKAVSIAPLYGKGDWQLYNVIDDPGETQDLAKAQNRQF